jgi:hypothetical protein
MKRQQHETSSKSKAKTRPIEPSRLAGVRGGRGLGIAVEVFPPPEEVAMQQHNEALVSLQLFAGPLFRIADDQGCS